MEPLSVRPGYNANPNDWVRYANHLEAQRDALERVQAGLRGTLEHLGHLAHDRDDSEVLKAVNEALGEADAEAALWGRNEAS